MASTGSGVAHVWEKQEIVLEAEKAYANPYTDAQVWVDLKGPEFDKRVYGFWDGDRVFRVRFVATAPGEWRWTSGSTPPDAGLAGKTGEFTAIDWTEEEKRENPNRRGFLRSTANGHALNYADGTPFFYLADTWWSCGTWRYPFKGKAPDPGYVPGPGMGFEEAVQFRKSQGYNGVAMIASFPSWQSDGPGKITDKNGVVLRASWTVDENCAQMPDESGNRPFLFPGKAPGNEMIVPDFDRINPSYFQSLDRKMQRLSDQGIVPFFESVRRDHGPSWKRYYDWPGSFIRYVQHLGARYGCYNFIFSGVHMDAAGKEMLSGREWNDVLTAHYREFGPLPFGQPQSTNITLSTYKQYGHRDIAPWLTLHGVGNSPRDHRVFALIEEMFRLPDPFPVLNNEPFYPYSRNPQAANIQGDQAANARACAWGSVLNGALAGHVYGTQGYFVTTGEPKQANPYIWEALAGERFLAPGQHMARLRDFMLSEGADYQNLVPDRASLAPNQKSDGLEAWRLSGWSSMMRTPDARLAIVYFEVDCPIATIRNFPPGSEYRARWFDPRTGDWLGAGNGTLKAEQDGAIHLPPFPDGGMISKSDWALKLVRKDR
ncbi:MAG: DUF5060 domain-containing protein [Candidatus Sumerlaeota bacterium]|nr:DUF5060 domain-containing protein [Candidatus Sumerlaeota bacterium]